jgi:rod shape determining protein RodA
MRRSQLANHGTPGRMTIGQKLGEANWMLVLLVTLIACVGFAMLYSAANGNIDPWMSRQLVRFAGGLVLMLAVAVVDIRFWMRQSYLIYLVGLLLLVYVDVAGEIGMGAQRWIDLKFFQLQPSEVMKVAIVMALARYFHGLDLDEVARPLPLIVPLGMILMPAGLVLVQPDLGTAGMLIMVSGAMFFAAGVRLWKFAVVGLGALAAIPIAWNFLREYQRQRILTFLDPESDPLGAGYHILQSKIAFGSGGVFGKGFLEGTQSHLSFLPERQTDFIFTMLAEEFGLVGSLGLLSLYALVIVIGYAIALRSRNHFGRLVAVGISTNLFLYVFINAAMVMGLIPVVGIPMPLISYGGTAMITVLFSIGLLMSIHIHRDVRIGQRGHGED